MGGIDPIDFTKNSINICNQVEEVKGYDTQIIDNLVVKIRVYLIKDLFIDVFYNADTERVSYSLIKSQNRIFGVDNTGNWHTHPFNEPVKHISCSPLSFDAFIKLVLEEIIKE